MAESSSEDNLRRIMEGLSNSDLAHDVSVAMYVEPMARLLMDNPNKAIDTIVSVYNTALDEAYKDTEGNNVRAWVEATCGGPHERVPHSVYNAVGAVYPYLDRKMKDRALGKVLSILDRLNYVYVNTIHTPGVREPLLLSDIQIKRWLYWPGLDEGRHLLGKNPLFAEWQFELMDEKGMFKRDRVQSDFCVAYSLLRSDFCNFGEDYVHVANPQFLDRTMQGIVAMRFARAQTAEQISEGRERLKVLLPESLHGRIDELRLRHDWTEPQL